MDAILVRIVVHGSLFQNLIFALSCGCFKAWKQWHEEDISCLMEPAIFDPVVEMQIMRYVQVGLLCVQEKAKDRPSILTVLSMLSNEIAVLPHPKLPAFTANHKVQETESSNIPIKNSSNKLTSTIVEGR